MKKSNFIEVDTGSESRQEEEAQSSICCKGPELVGEEKHRG